MLDGGYLCFPRAAESSAAFRKGYSLIFGLACPQKMFFGLILHMVDGHLCEEDASKAFCLSACCETQ